VLIVAGGIGLAPLRPAICALLDAWGRYEGATLLYGGRSPDQLLYEDELQQWRERGLEVVVTVDSAGPEWRGSVGVVPRLVGRAELDWQRVSALVCGPEIMMRFAVDAVRARGVQPADIFASLERNMQCGIGHCGHCQLGPSLICRDGPVYSWDALEPWLRIPEL
jgi:NAD(P)H-flavin reductase